jgi:hypothetical protein
MLSAGLFVFDVPECINCIWHQLQDTYNHTPRPHIDKTGLNDRLPHKMLVIYIILRINKNSVFNTSSATKHSSYLAVSKRFENIIKKTFKNGQVTKWWINRWSAIPCVLLSPFWFDQSIRWCGGAFFSAHALVNLDAPPKTCRPVLHTCPASVASPLALAVAVHEQLAPYPFEPFGTSKVAEASRLSVVNKDWQTDEHRHQ